MNTNIYHSSKFRKNHDKYKKWSSLTSWVKSSLTSCGRHRDEIKFKAESDGRVEKPVIITAESRRHYGSAQCALEMLLGNQTVNRKTLQVQQSAVALWTQIQGDERCLIALGRAHRVYDM
jgi:hypothetical protein